MKRLAPQLWLSRAAEALGNGLYRNRASATPATGPWQEGRWLLVGHQRLSRVPCNDGLQMLGFCLHPPSGSLSLAHRLPVGLAFVLQLSPLGLCHWPTSNILLVVVEPVVAEGQIRRQAPPAQASRLALLAERNTRSLITLCERTTRLERIGSAPRHVCRFQFLTDGVVSAGNEGPCPVLAVQLLSH